MKSTIVAILAVFSLIFATAAQAQKDAGRAVRKAAQTVSISAEDLRKPELMKAESVTALGDGFTASRNLNTIDVHIPGAYMDSLSSSAVASLPVQLAAAAFMKVMKVDAKSVDEILAGACIGSKEGRTGSGDRVMFHTFKMSNGHKYKIFVYLNEFDGLMAIVSRTP
jgi:hypothetical protein